MYTNLVSGRCGSHVVASGDVVAMVTVARRVAALVVGGDVEAFQRGVLQVLADGDGEGGGGRQHATLLRKLLLHERTHGPHQLAASRTHHVLQRRSHALPGRQAALVALGAGRVGQGKRA